MMLSNLSIVRREYLSSARLARCSALLAVVGSGCAIALSGCGHKQVQAALPPPAVKVFKAIQEDVPVNGDWVATLDGDVNAQIQPQVSGYLISQLYREGSYVRKGQVLFEIDPQTFQAVLNQAKAQLAQAQAHLTLAEINVRRDTPLVQQHAIAQSVLDTETADQQQAVASVKAAEAAVEHAQINLNFTHVRSLTDGIAGIASTQVGNLVAPGTVLTSVSKVNPIRVYFPISEQEYMRFSGDGTARFSGLVGQTKNFELRLELAGGAMYPQHGRVSFVDRQVDPQTGTIRLVALFPNPGNLLRPGQFGRVHAVTSVNRSAVLVPQRAVTELQGKQEIAVVGPNHTVSVRSVKMGERMGALWIVESGLNAGETVITEGNNKVVDGMTVDPAIDSTLAEGGR